jgi:hypothetical protein
LLGGARVAELGSVVRDALASSHALELRPWAEQEGAA